MTAVHCFDTHTLKDYLLGKLPDEESDLIAAHLEACLTCEATVSQLDRASDTLTDGLRQPIPPISGERSSNESLRRALNNAQALAQAGEREMAVAAVDGSILRDYRLLESLGSGGMGTVFKAVHSRLDRLVAVKLLPARRLGDEQAVARFQREMRVIGQLSHPAIVQATDAGEVDGTHFLVMEFVEGFDLNQIARAVGTLSIPDACEMARQAALGLEYAHQQGIVHRDIKPSNLMLALPDGGQALRNSELAGNMTSEGSTTFGQFRIPKCLTPAYVKILDLGLALLSGEQAPVDELTTVGQLMGTLDYMAPEQIEDSHLVGPRADIYALAATLFRLLTGSAPFAKSDRKTPLQKLRALATQAAPLIRERRADIPADLATIIDRALSREPKDRPASMTNFAAALAPWCEGHDLAALAHSASQLCSHHAPRDEPIAPRNFERVHRLNEPVIRSAVPASQIMAAGERSVRDAERDGYVGRNWKLLTAALLLLVALGAVITIQTNNGQLVIETMRDDVEVRIKKSGRTVEQLAVTTKSGKTMKLATGEYEIEFVGSADGLTIDKKQFVLKRGEVVIAKVSEIPNHTHTHVAMADPNDTGDSPQPSAAPKSRIIKPDDIVDRDAKGMESFETANPDWQAEKKIRELLLKKINVDFDDVPLTEVVKNLEQQSGVVMLLDTDALNDEAIPLDSPVTWQLSEVPVTVAMQVILRPLKLDLIIDAGQVLITTMTKSAEFLVTRTYPVGKLLPGVRLAIPRLQENARELLRQNNGGGGGFFDIPPDLFPQPMTIRRQFGGGKVDNAIIVTPDGHFSALLEILSPDSWSFRGGAGTCNLIHNVLSVRQTQKAHLLIEALLRTVESAFLEPLTEPVEIRPFGYPREADRRLREQLTKPLDAEYTDAPLTDVASDLAKQLQVQILLDVEALNDEAIPLESPITRNLKNVPANVLIRRMFQPLKLEVQVDHGLLVITTMTKVAERPVTKVYDIREFVARGVTPEQIIAGLESGTSGPWESSGGGAGRAFDFADTLLVITQTMSVHDEIAKFLTSLRTQLHDQPEIPRVISMTPKKPPVATSSKTPHPVRRN